MSRKPLIAVVGADGFVGGGFAEAMKAERIVYGSCRPGDVHINNAEPLLRKADVIINASGFRVRRGLTYADYQRCHQGATSVFVPWVRKDALFVHMSSAHVLGKSSTEVLGNDSLPNPGTYPSAAYTMAKYEADQYLEREAAERGFRLIFLRPTILWDRQGDTSLIDNLVRMAKRGIVLRLYPRGARHHLCNLNILTEVARRVIERNDLPHLTALVVADPFTITNRQLEATIERYASSRLRRVPVPASLMSAVLRPTFHSKHPTLDLATWGDIFGVLHLDTVYDPFATFRLLGIDPSPYAFEKTVEPFIRQALQTSPAAEAIELGERRAHV